MFTWLRSAQRARGLLILGVCLLLLSALPPRPTQAAFKQLAINNGLADFKDGQFQRTALSTVLDPVASTKIVDQKGGIQLGPIGLLKQWFDAPFRLKKPLMNMGATAVGDRLYVIGGAAKISQIVTDPVAEVWSAQVSLVDGALTEEWRAETALPAVQGSNQTNPNFTRVISEITSPAVTSLTDPNGKSGYIYVIGGNAKVGTFDFSSYAVRIGRVANDGTVTWSVGAPLPTNDPTNPFAQPRGAQSAVALSHKINGKTYIYLIGGLQRFVQGGSTKDKGSTSVYYALVGSNGRLVKPSSPGTEGWDLTQPIPLTPPPTNADAGLWDAAGVADNFVASTLASADEIYLMGGQVTPNPAPSYSSKVYRAQINSNGTLAWDDPNAGGWAGELPAARSGSGAVPFRGNIYMTGGAPSGGRPDKGVLTSYIEDNLELHRFDQVPPGVEGTGTNLLKSDALNPNTRAFHGTAIVQADTTSSNSAFVYVLGGFGATNTDPSDAPRDTVIYGKIGGSEDISSTGYASDGWFYSQPFAINFNQAQVQEIDWTAAITRTAQDMDIAIDYRLSSSNDCANATWPPDWTALPNSASDPAHRSITGQNVAEIGSPLARCFQYRAKLTTADLFATPQLLNVSIKVFVPGNPDLWVNDLSESKVNGTFSGLNISIRNEVHPPNTETITLDVKDGGKNPAGGSFFAHVYIFGPSDTVTPPGKPPLPIPPPGSKAYANINYNQMPANTTLPLTQWKNPTTNALVNLVDYFTAPGLYKVYVVVDTGDYIIEGDTGGEQNNVSTELSVVIPNDIKLYKVALPVVVRP
jgi:hypothetical protein